MLKYDKNTQTFEASSEVDGCKIMTFRATVDIIHPNDTTLDIKKESETLYRQYRDQASEDRMIFEDSIFNMIRFLNDISNNCPPNMENAEIQDGNNTDQEVDDYVEG